MEKIKRHCYHVEDARKYGMIEALMLCYIRYWVERDSNKCVKYDLKHIRNTYNYLFESQIINALKNLIKNKAIISKDVKDENDYTYSYISLCEDVQKEETKNETSN